MNRSAMPGRAFITGATGCIGGALVERLSHAGYRIVALVRDRSRASYLNEFGGVELVVGDLGARDCIANAMRSCEVVFHAAAKVHAPPDADEREFTRVNVEGTRNVVEAAIENRVKSLVFFSTVAVYPESDETLDEDSATGPATAYGASKLAAEKVVLERAAASPVKATVLRLPVVYGPRDRGNVARLIDAIRRGRYFIVGDGANLKSLVAVENVVEAAMLVAGAERARGEIYIVCDQRAYTQREIAETIAEALGQNRRFIQLPHGIAMTAGLIADWAGKLTGANLPISADRIHKLSNHTRYSSAKIERELEFEPHVTLREGLTEIIKICFEPQSSSSPASSLG
jgi:nucleoside-diphosphate-sugar epimerase